jgi:type IV pilus assembly protein PilY1
MKIFTIKTGIALLAVLLIASGVGTLLAQSAPSAPNIPPVVLSSDPLYATTTGDKPALALALSVEFPTVGAQYTWDGTTATGSNSLDDAYSNIKEYLGYYDAEACYAYNNAPTETPATGLSATDYKRFDRVGGALPLATPDPLLPFKTSRKCTDAFSGNFLNWASNSAIDMLRLSLSGGDRYIDTKDLTILQRAVIPNGDPICMWNTTNFPAKRLQKDGAGTGQYWGAVPLKMIAAAGGNDIWVANTLNRIYFKAGTGTSGSCSDPSSYALAGTSGSTVGPVVLKNQDKPSDASVCASENGNCAFSGVKEIWYGANKSWAVAPVNNGTACTNAVFTDPISGTAKSCYIRSYAGTWTPSNNNQLNSDGFFFSRVSVCASDATGNLDKRDYTFCTRYPAGDYKPTGAIQKYSDQLRIAAFGYLIDQTDSASGGRYGGVLRAPMKFVGQRTFDIYGQENTPTGGNPNTEWDENTGIFSINPDNDATQTPPISGVINYLNKFGRTNSDPSKQGRYKKYDPVSELYYQVLRYLQGLPPSPAAISNTSADMYDGFPVFKTWTDPYGNGRSSTASYSCLKSNIVVVGDIHTHDGPTLPTASATGNIPDLSYWTGIVDKFEQGSTTTAYLDGDGVSRFTSNPNSANGSPRTDSIIGAAYWAHTHDIRGTNWTDSPSQQRPGLRVKSFLFDVNEYGDSSKATQRLYQNQFFTAAKYGGFESDPSNPGAKPFNTFGNPFKRQDGTNDNNVWQKQAAPGEASTYYLQSSARGVLTAFDDIFGRAATSARSIAGAATSSSSLQVALNNVTFQGAFNATDWSGDLLAVPLLVDTSNAVTIGATNYWSASDQLMALTSPATTRNIYIGRTGGNAVPTAAAFTWAAISSTANTTIKDALDRVTPTAAPDGLAQDRIAYLRGDRSKEGSVFRVRDKLLGDIINSGIAYSGAPPLNVFSSAYSTFYTANKARVPAVFVGANDGMLHAFNATLSGADKGKELFSYIPSWMAPKLSALTRKDYAVNHQSYVDGTPTVREANLGSETSQSWKTVLVAGTGGGGRGVFALDVTDPTTFTASNVLWEFTQNDDIDMGFVVGRPQILKIRTSAHDVVPATYKWFAVVASGVDNYVPDAANNFSATGNPALFFLDLAKASGQSWILGTNYFKLSVPIDSTLSTSLATGLVNFSAAIGTFGDTQEIFAGDLHGKLWKIDLTKPDYPGMTLADFNMGKLTGYGPSTAPKPLYIARDKNGLNQPITVSPLLATGEGRYTTYVTFGTGKYLEASDRTTSIINTLYSIYDNSEITAADGGSTSSIVSGRGRLQVRTFDTTTQTTTGAAFRWGRATSDSDTTRRSGWYADFPGTGEREASDGVVFGNTFVLGALIPGTTGSASACSAAGGSGREWNINIDTGLAQTKVSVVGILGKPLVLDVPSATTTSTTDNTGRQIKTMTSVVVQQGSTGLGSSTTLTQQIITGRLSWRQINNYLDLHVAP